MQQCACIQGQGEPPEVVGIFPLTEPVWDHEMPRLRVSVTNPFCLSIQFKS